MLALELYYSNCANGDKLARMTLYILLGEEFVSLARCII